MVNPSFDDDAADGMPEEIYGPLETPQDHAREIVRCLELLQADFGMTLDEACRLIYSFEDELRASDSNLAVEDDFLSKPYPVKTKGGSRNFLQILFVYSRNEPVARPKDAPDLPKETNPHAIALHAAVHLKRLGEIFTIRKQMEWPSKQKGIDFYGLGEAMFGEL